MTLKSPHNTLNLRQCFLSQALSSYWRNFIKMPMGQGRLTPDPRHQNRLRKDTGISGLRTGAGTGAFGTGISRTDRAENHCFI